MWDCQSFRFSCYFKYRFFFFTGSSRLRFIHSRSQTTGDTIKASGWRVSSELRVYVWIHNDSHWQPVNSWNKSRMSRSCISFHVHRSHRKERPKLPVSPDADYFFGWPSFHWVSEFRSSRWLRMPSSSSNIKVFQIISFSLRLSSLQLE